MICCSCEPSLEEVLSDSLTQAVMAADGVDPRELEATLREVAEIRARPHGAAKGMEAK